MRWHETTASSRQPPAAQPPAAQPCLGPPPIRFWNQKVELFADDHGRVLDPNERFRRMQKVRVRGGALVQWRQPTLPPPRRAVNARASFYEQQQTWHAPPNGERPRPSTVLPMVVPMDDPAWHDTFEESLAQYRAQCMARESRAARADEPRLSAQGRGEIDARAAQRSNARMHARPKAKLAPSTVWHAWEN